MSGFMTDWPADLDQREREMMGDCKMADFTLADHGSIMILTPVSEAAQDWADEHLPTDGPMWGQGGIVIEPRYIEPIVTGIIADGLEIE